jgi:hypothetical protein
LHKYLVVAGGGGGGNEEDSGGAGGGAGGYRCVVFQVCGITAYPITVGGGGAAE